MRGLLIFILASWSVLDIAESGTYSCAPITEVDAGDYRFDVIPVKKEEVVEIDSVQELDLSTYQGKFVLFTVFSSECGWCMADLHYFNRYEEQWPKDSVVMVNAAIPILE